MADDELSLTGGRRAVRALRDLAVGAAHPDQQTAHEELTVVRVGALDLLDASAPFTPRFDGHRTHCCIVASGHAASASPDSEDDDRGRRSRIIGSMASSPAKMLDVLVVGAGPAGVIASLRAARLGARTALITRDEFGGMAANDGPVPVRTLAQAARLIREARQLPRYGIDAVEPSLDYVRLLARVHEVTEDVRRHSLAARRSRQLPAWRSTSGPARHGSSTPTRSRVTARRGW